MLGRLQRVGFLLGINLASFYHFFKNSSRQFPADWVYIFEPFSLFVRSAVWHYHTLPIHNPWRCGGTDFVTNPQTRLFTPFLLLDLFASPQWSQLLTVFIFALLGTWGCYALLRHFQIRPWSATVASAFFISCSWLALHFLEGHTVYAEMQLLPFVFLCGLRFRERLFQFLTVTILSVTVFNGAIQAFVFELYVLACAFLYPMQSWREIKEKIRHPVIGWPRVKQLAILFALFSSIKILPVLLTNKSRTPMIDNTVMSAKLWFATFLYPFQTNDMPWVTDGLPYWFHEFGCYLGWGAVLLLLASLFQRDFRLKTRRLWVFFIVWLWIGTGFLTPVNPWNILQRLPLLNHAHIQSRALIIMMIFFTLLLGFALDRWEKKRWALVLFSAIILGENFFVHWHVTRVLDFRSKGPTPGLSTFIQYDTLSKTYPTGYSNEHYLLDNRGATDCGDRAWLPSEVRHYQQEDYKGEIYFDTGEGEATIRRFTPGRLVVAYSAKVPSVIAVNTNTLWGWKSETPGVEAVRRGHGDRVRLKVPAGTGEAVLAYSPRYLWPCVLIWLVGVWLYLKEGWAVVRSRRLK